MRMAIGAVLLCLLFVGAVVAADVSGKWNAQVPGRGGELQPTAFVFKVDGSKLTGTMTREGSEPNNLDNGKVEGDTISFSVTRNLGGNEIKFLYKGTVSGAEIKFSREGGQGGTREFTAKRSAT